MLCATLRNDEKRQNQNSDSEGRGFESRRAYQNVLMKDAATKTTHESAVFSHIMHHF